MRHPGKHELFAYAEALVDSATAVPARQAAHVAKCRRCAREVAAMRQSLEFVGRAPALEPSADLTARILIGAQKARRAAHAREARRHMVFALLKGAACAAGIVFVAAVYFSAALQPPQGKTAVARSAAPAKRVENPLPSIDSIREAVAEVATLEAAVSAPSDQPLSLWERERRRAVRALDADIAAALAALERNPGCRRATDLVSTNVQRQAETLRDLYIERSL